MLEKTQRADRLAEICMQIGFALWQLQELEGCTAIYFVLLTQASKGMGRSIGEALVEKAQSKTFGATIKQLEKANLLPTDLAKRYISLLEERNWLVHRSRIDSRGAIHHELIAQKLLLRLDAIADEAAALLKMIGLKMESFAQENGVSNDQIELQSARLLREWQTNSDD
ncbi:hypothetical protein [Undibacterium crateris]|uniref:hypothetical protein n=1 Tax=Undibacterium crateris TaxID=2528175 RepID=UPI001389E1E4|nr:hypothetical protein [Undibacterium crateris]NDI85497.1 hypothetical protein [Undibacterium crateris]